MLPCKTPEEIVNRQAIALRDAILEAKKLEKVRLTKLTNAHNRERRAELDKRFEIERAGDEEKINQLMNDLERVKQSASKGEIVTKASAPPPLESKDANRFELYDTSEQVKFRRAFTDTFNKLDNKFENKMRNQHKFDYYAEKKREILLREKSNVLKQLVSVQLRELADRGEDCYATAKNFQFRGAREGSDTRSELSSRSSNYSCATFATNNGGIHNRTTGRSQAPKVPRLTLPKPK